MTQFAIDHSSQTIAYIAEDGTILYANAAAAAALPKRRWTRSSAVASGTGCRPPTVSGGRSCGARRVEHPPVQIETAVRTTTGAVRHIAVTLDHLGAAQGAFVVAYARDITERRRAQESLRESEAQLRALVDTLPDLVWLKDLEGVYLSCNRRFEDFFGAREEDIVGKTDHDFLSPELADFFRARDRAAMDAGGPTANEEEIVFASDGHQRDPRDHQDARSRQRRARRRRPRGRARHHRSQALRGSPAGERRALSPGLRGHVRLRVLLRQATRRLVQLRLGHGSRGAHHGLDP